MFLRKKKNRSGSTSIQVIQKVNGKYKVHKTIGCATTQQEIEKLEKLGKQEIDIAFAQPKLFASEKDLAVEQTLSAISNADIRTVGPEIVFGKIFLYLQLVMQIFVLLVLKLYLAKYSIVLDLTKSMNIFSDIL